MPVQTNLVEKLEAKAIETRQTILTMIHKAGSGHPGGSLSAADMITALYFNEMNLTKDNLKDYDRDRFVLSKGHIAPALYSVLIGKGILEADEVMTLREYGSRLQGHPDMKKTPGVEISTGSLGQGIAAAVGMAIGLKRDNSKAKVFTMVGDGECGEGQVWESVQTAAKYGLDNLTIYVDYNGIQNDGFTEDILPLGDLTNKFRAFGCYVKEIDGHNMKEILLALDEMREVKGQPKCILGKGLKGRGVSFMENVPKWHGVAPNDEEFAQAMAEVKEGLK